MPLSREQQSIATIVLGSSQGQLSLAGGAALIYHRITDRATKDLDAFAHDVHTDIAACSQRAISSLQAAGYQIDDRTPPGAESYIRKLSVSRPSSGRGRPKESVQLDIGMDHRCLPAIGTPLGPVLDPRDLGANKLLAARDRVAPRDADDIARLTARFNFAELYELAQRKEPQPLSAPYWAAGFRRVAAEDAEFYPNPTTARQVKAFMRELAAHVERGTPVPRSPYAAPMEARSPDC